MANIYVIAGCNGAGKTTASFTILPEILNCKEFVNADEIAKGLSPFQPENASFEAGRIMLSRIRELANNNIDFAFETTLSTKSYLHLLNEFKKSGHSIILIFFWLNGYELAITRVRQRVKQGGHSIPEEVIIRRYKRGLENLPEFILLSDHWEVWNNSLGSSEVIATGEFGENKIFNSDIWNLIIGQ